MESEIISESCKHNSQLFTNEGDLNKSSEDTQSHQNQKSNNNLSNSKDQLSSNLSNIYWDKKFIKIPLLIQENLAFNSKVYQEYIKIYHNFTSLYYASYNHNKFGAQLIIYDIKTKREKLQEIDARLANIIGSKCLTQLPNGDLFCFGSKRSNDEITSAFSIDKNFHVYELPSRRHINCASAIYYDRNIYCFGGGGDNLSISANFSNRFELETRRWVNLSPLPKPINYCTIVIFNGNILISNSENINLWLYSIDIDSFSIIPYEFHNVRRVMISAEERLYLIESRSYWRFYESDIWDEFSWKFVANFGNACFLHGLAYSGLYNKESKSIYILGLKNWESGDIETQYWKFNLNEKALNEEKRKKCRIF